jgi:nucleoside 2-deoxyribosyltransferase
MARFYLASGLDNMANARAFRDILVAKGHTQTYDWTEHGPVFAGGLDRLREVANLEVEGVRAADFVVGVLPGGRGTHFELGVAHGLGKSVYLYAPRPELISAHPETCAFYHLDSVVSLDGDPANCAGVFAEIAHREFGR